MDRERWALTEKLYHEALEREPSLRAAFVKVAGVAREDLARDVEAMLGAHERAESFLEKPALEMALSDHGLTAGDLSRQFGLRLNTPGSLPDLPQPPLGFWLAPGVRLGPYEIEAAISAGGMGEVYRARDCRLDRMVALKILAGRLMGRRGFRERFEAEAKAISRLNHPNICTLYDIGREGQIDYLVMEHLEGETLAERLTRGPLCFTEAAAFAEQICLALAYSHRQGVIHRDLKPGNIILTSAGPKLVDFGLARWEHEAEILAVLPPTAADSSLTVTGLILGTPQYMAPEQIERRTADARTDIFALGAVVFEMASGRKAFAGATAAEVMRQILTVDAPELSDVCPDLPRSFSRTVSRCLRRPPEARWQSAGDLALALNQASQARTSLRRLARGGRVALIAAVLVLVAIIRGGSGADGKRPVLVRRDTVLRTLYAFLAQGEAPSWPDGLVVGPDGAVYGATVSGGSPAWAGAIFRLDPPDHADGQWRHSTLYAFTGGADGASPQEGFLIGGNGHIYGTTAWGGIAGNGTVFELTPPSQPSGAWNEKVLHHFTRRDGDGCFPNGQLAWGKHGEFFGTAQNGGTAGQGKGIVFEMRPSAPGTDIWSEHVIFTFRDAATGANPEGGLVADQNGALYGTTGYGSGYQAVVYKLTLPDNSEGQWTETVLRRLRAEDGDGVTGTDLVLGPDGELYGSTKNLPGFGGSIFALRPPAGPRESWRETILHRFAGSPGDAPNVTGLALGPNGKLYGVKESAIVDGVQDSGAIFELSPASNRDAPWRETVLYRFHGGDGSIPHSPLLIGPHILLGATIKGGPSRGGTVFQLTF